MFQVRVLLFYFKQSMSLSFVWILCNVFTLLCYYNNMHVLLYIFFQGAIPGTDFGDRFWLLLQFYH